MRHCILLLAFLQAYYAFGDPLVKLPTGWIRGRRGVTLQNTSYFAFEKVPFAKPPVGELRFRPPQPPAAWEGVLNTTRLDTICYQLVEEGPESEDCLYLNVFTPRLPDGDAPLLPVMFYIHGGGFYDGNATDLGPDRFLDNDVISVAASYRLGPFGFLATGDGVVHGNNGLKDQLLALLWVHDNIKLFGGDPDQVTIFGHSAGGASVSYFLLNEATRGLFKGAISQSGTALGPWALQRDPKTVTSTFATYLNTTAPFNDTQQLVDYLRHAPAEELKDASHRYYFEHIFNGVPEDMSYLQGLYFGPVLEANHDGAFITEKMYGLLKDGKVVKVPLMIGVTSEECLEYFRDFNISVSALGLYDNNLDWLVPRDMRIESKENRTKMGQLIRELYTGGEAFSEHVADGVRFSSDNLLTRSTIKHAELYSKLESTYFYVFSYDGEVGGIDVHYDGAGLVGHGEENKYLMCTGAKCDLSEYPEADRVTQKRLTKIWTDFAKHGVPIPEASSLLQNVSWPTLDVQNGDFMYLDIDVNLTVRNHPKDSYQRWTELFAMGGNDDFDTY